MSSHENPWIFAYFQPDSATTTARLQVVLAPSLPPPDHGRLARGCGVFPQRHGALSTDSRRLGDSVVFFRKKWGKSMGNPGFSVLKWFGFASHRFSELKWSSMTWMISGSFWGTRIWEMDWEILIFGTWICGCRWLLACFQWEIHYDLGID